MILKEAEQELKKKLRTLETMDMEEGSYEMWKKQPLTQIMFGNLELAYYLDLQEKGIDWRKTIESMLTYPPQCCRTKETVQ